MNTPAMPTLRIDFSINDKALALIDELRDSASRENFLIQVLELGLCELIENTARMHRDYLTHRMAGETKDYRQGRTALFQLGEPQPQQQPPPKSSNGSAPDPTPNHVPRGARG